LVTTGGRSRTITSWCSLGKDRRVLDCGYTGDLANSDHRAVKCTLRVQYKLDKPEVKSERSKMVMKDFSALVGEDDDAQAAREAFAAAVEAELNRDPALSDDEISPTYHHMTLSSRRCSRWHQNWRIGRR
jgi:hypothetical protein